jgi:hypothetical protein
MRGVEKLASVRRMYRTVAIDVYLFPFPVCNAQLIGDWYENNRGPRNTIMFLIMHQYYWRTDAPCANSNGGPNMKKKILAHCAWSALPIGAPMPPAPLLLPMVSLLLLADRTVQCASPIFKPITY